MVRTALNCCVVGIEYRDNNFNFPPQSEFELQRNKSIIFKRQLFDSLPVKYVIDRYPFVLVRGTFGVVPDPVFVSSLEFELMRNRAGREEGFVMVFV